MQEGFTVQNVKCGGCAQAIQTGLAGLEGVRSVSVDIPGGIVTVEGDTLARELIAARLKELGYPERGTD